MVGNCALWWGKDRKGYTCNLDDAGLYTLKDALAERGSDIPVHKDIAEACVVRHVRWDHLAQNGVRFQMERDRTKYRKGLEAKLKDADDRA